MEGSLRKRGSKWYYSYESYDSSGNKKRIERVGGKTKKEAQQKLNEALYKRDCGYIEVDNTLLKDYLNSWLLQYIKPNRKENTFFRYQGVIQQAIMPCIGNIQLRNLKPVHIESMLAFNKNRGLKNTTLQNIYTILNSSLNRALKLQLINNNVCKFVDRPKREKFVAETLSLNEFNIIMDSLSDSYNDYLMKLALTITLELGLRRGELAGLTWENIDLENNKIKIINNLIKTNAGVNVTTPKTEESKRTLIISDMLVTMLKQHKKIINQNKLKYGEFYTKYNTFNNIHYDFLFVWENGIYVDPNYWTHRFSRILKKLSINKRIRWHDLRHTNATLLLSQGINFKTIQIRLGHADINTTLNIYSHVTEEMQKEATTKINNLMQNVIGK
ncbi:MAG: tyrosine-type recombinase/integrase [Clostridium chrysemydis]|uniref:tyrosine-type recombinase/integrase n=1 Tax=Clostridium chrysemydis TaxID=2665504 RepID=UPI003F2F4E46